MNKEILHKSLIDNLDKNYSELSNNFKYRFKVFSAFNTLIIEINKCLILELNRASLTLTNHLVERLLKLALIYNEVGVGPIPLEQWNEKFEPANKKYISKNMWDTIKLCRENDLINDEEKDILNKEIKNLFRNGFSHGDSTKIMGNLPDTTEMYFINSNLGDEVKKININQKASPTFQSLHIAEFAKIKAKPYFNFVLLLINKIESRLNEKKKINS